MTVQIFMFLGTTIHVIYFMLFFQDSEYIGDVYQDDDNQAALLLYRDKTDDALLMVSKILKEVKWDQITPKRTKIVG